MKTILIALALTSASASATMSMQVSIAQCIFTRENPTQKWTYSGAASNGGGYDLAPGVTEVGMIVLSGTWGLCNLNTGTGEDAVKVEGVIIEGERIDRIRDDCRAEGKLINYIGHKIQTINPGEGFSSTATMADQSQILVHYFSVPRAEFGGIFAYVERYCRSLNP